MRNAFGMRWIVATVLCSIAMAGCGDVNGKLKEQAAITGQEQANRTVEATNEDLGRKAAAAEVDLGVLQRFYVGVSGVYVGTMQLPGASPMQVRLAIASTLPSYSLGGRVRSLAEIEADLAALALNVQVTQWDASIAASSGCVFEKIKPNIANGTLDLKAASCPFSYSIYLADLVPISQDSGSISSTVGSSISSRLISGVLHTVQYLGGIRYSQSRSQVGTISLSRLAPGEADPNPMIGAVYDEDTARRLQEMESDLAQRRHFYQYVSGSYNGTMAGPADRNSHPFMFQTRMTFTATLPPARPQRVRPEGEIQADLSSLALTIQVTQSHLGSGMTVGCVFTAIKPETQSGMIHLAASDCPEVFDIWLSSAAIPNLRGEAALAQDSVNVASTLSQGSMHSVPSLAVKMTAPRGIFPFTLVNGGAGT